eukprot:scaffold28586_cov107-Skeletonema_dohrnii-CCMP3373.AAC.1
MDGGFRHQRRTRKSMEAGCARMVLHKNTKYFIRLVSNLPHLLRSSHIHSNLTAYYPNNHSPEPYL